VVPSRLQAAVKALIAKEMLQGTEFASQSRPGGSAIVFFTSVAAEMLVAKMIQRTDESGIIEKPILLGEGDSAAAYPIKLKHDEPKSLRKKSQAGVAGSSRSVCRDWQHEAVDLAHRPLHRPSISRIPKYGASSHRCSCAR
jgi:hypothetical protein